MLRAVFLRLRQIFFDVLSLHIPGAQTGNTRGKNEILFS
ncbi:MAG: hypothetical protein JWQ40_268 [Segetibacter sp.]|nr:hypothetical protein [Segetibacter sp.]